MPKLNARNIAISVVFILGVATATYLAADALSIDLGDEGVAENVTGDDRFVTGGLRTANRDHFAVCVDTHGVDPSAAQNALSVISDALNKASKHPDWIGSVGEATPTVDVGCPQAPAALQPNAQTTRTGRVLLVDTVSEEATAYKVHLYLTSDEVIRETFRDAPPIATQERLRRNLDQFETVTYAIFATTLEASDVAYMEVALLIGADLKQSTAFYELRATAAPTENVTPVASDPASQDSDNES